MAYAGPFSGDVAVGGHSWQRAMQWGIGAVMWHVICPYPLTREGANVGGCRQLVVGAGDAVQWVGV